MINAAPLPTTSLTPPPPSFDMEQPTAFYTKDGNQVVNAPAIPPKKSKSKTKLLIGLLVLVVLVAGAAVGLFLQTQTQDTRQQASEGTTETISPNCPLPPNAVWTGPGLSSGQCTHDGIMFTWKDVFSGNQSETGWEIYRSDPNDPTKNLDLDGKPTLLPIAKLPKNDTDSLSFLLKPNGFSQTTFYRIRIRPFYTFANGTRCHREAQIGHQCSGGSPSSCANPPVVTNRNAVWNENNTQVVITWGLQSGTVKSFEIWNISHEPLDPQNPNRYYLQKLATLSGDARSYTTTNLSSLPTRKFLIKALTSNDDVVNLCSDEWALCINPVITNRIVKSSGNYTYQFTWKPVQAPLEKYQIWLIAEGELDPANPSAYYLANLADNINPAATSYTLTIPDQYKNRPSYRFLLRAVNVMENGAPACYNQWAMGDGSNTPPSTGRCTLSFTVTAPTATPTNPPNATATPTSVPSATATPTNQPNATATPTSVPSIGCNQNCLTNADCSNPNHICFTDSSGVNRCRLETNPQNSSCQAAGQVSTPAPTQPSQDVVLPDELPVSGPEDWTTWLKAGLAILGMGAALLLML